MSSHALPCAGCGGDRGREGAWGGRKGGSPGGRSPEQGGKEGTAAAERQSQGPSGWRAPLSARHVACDAPGSPGRRRHPIEKETEAQGGPRTLASVVQRGSAWDWL